MFRASQIYGRASGATSTAHGSLTSPAQSNTSWTTSRGNAGKGRGPAGSGAFGGSSVSYSDVDWNDNVTRDEYRRQVADQLPGPRGCWGHGDHQWGHQQGWPEWSSSDRRSPTARPVTTVLPSWRPPQQIPPPSTTTKRPTAQPVQVLPVRMAISTQRVVPARPPIKPAVVAVPVQPAVTTMNTIVIQGQGVGVLSEDAVDQACRQVAISEGFSVHEMVRIVHASLVHVEFPHREAAARFAEATKGEINIGAKTCSVRHPFGASNQTGDACSATADPTDTVIVRQLGEATEKQLLEAFSKIAPRIRGVRIPKDFSGHSKGHGFIFFHEVHEAVTALRHFRSQVGMIAGRRVTAEFAPAQSFEETLEREAREQQSAVNIRASHQQALSGPNADMWASYLAMFKGDTDGKANQGPSANGGDQDNDDAIRDKRGKSGTDVVEPQAKRAKLEPTQSAPCPTDLATPKVAPATGLIPPSFRGAPSLATLSTSFPTFTSPTH